jgi:hypothetical protein
MPGDAKEGGALSCIAGIPFSKREWLLPRRSRFSLPKNET